VVKHKHRINSSNRTTAYRKNQKTGVNRCYEITENRGREMKLLFWGLAFIAVFGVAIWYFWDVAMALADEIIVEENQ